MLKSHSVLPLLQLLLTPALILSCELPLSAQQATHLVWALDAGSQLSPSPVLRVYQPDGVEVATVAVPGAAQARSFSFDDAGNCYVCRGDQVRVLDSTGIDTGIVLLPPSGSGQAQDVLPRPPSQIWVSWGASATNSRLCRYDNTGALLDTFGPDIMDHPRRITAAPGAVPGEIFIANRGTSEILVFDTTIGFETFSLASDLNTNSLGPNGLQYDVTRNAVWVVGDWGQTTAIGTIDATTLPSAFTTHLNYGAGAVAGMDAPSNCYFDRFRRLYVAGRSQNGGVAGVYIFDAESGTTLTEITAWPSSGTAPVNVVDVEAQPIPSEICGPVDATGDLIIQTGVTHDYKFRAPAFAGAFYIAALSTPWASSSVTAPYIPGILDDTLTFLAPDPRGLPWTCDGIFNVTTGVVGFGGPPIWPPAAFPCPTIFGETMSSDLDILVGGFAGFLDASGEGIGQIRHAPLNFPAFLLDGFPLSLSFVTIDLALTSGIGFIANPVTLTIKNAPVGVVPCP